MSFASVQRNAPFFAVMLSIAIVTLALVLATLSLIARM